MGFLEIVRQTGTDPEVLVGNGTIQWAGALVKARKATPTVVRPWEVVGSKGLMAIPLAGTSSEFRLYADGAAMEFTVPPSSCHAYLVDYIRHGLWLVSRSMGTSVTKIHPTSTHTFSDYWFTGSRVAKEDLDLGCNTSENVYGDRYPRLEVPDSMKLWTRSAGFHVHFSFLDRYKTLLNNEDIERGVRFIDWLLGPVSVLMLEGLESPERRKWYGRPGEYRLPVHGVEYRTMSSSALVHPVVTHVVLDMARAAMELGVMMRLGKSTQWSSTWNYIDSASAAEATRTGDMLMELDVEAARAHMAEHEEVYEKLCNCIWPTLTWALIKKIITRPASQMFMLDVGANWGLNYGPECGFGPWLPHSNRDMATVIGWTRAHQNTALFRDGMV